VIALLLAALFFFAGIGLTSGEESGEAEATGRPLPLVCEPGIPELPCAEGVEPGFPYAVTLLTHCQLEWAYFDGRYWVPRAPVSEPGGEANFADGIMTLAAPDEAVFVAYSGPEVRFRPAGADYRPPPCA
jgi:hypothetical protein